jgi:hypothetical protein
MSPLLDELLGARAARRLRIGSALAIAVLVTGGCAVFLFESQTLGRIAIAIAGMWGTCWILARYLAAGGRDPVGDLHRRGRLLVGVGAALVVSGWVAFFAVWEELGLLLVVLGALPLLLRLVGVQREPLWSPLDGPPFGETEQ